MRKALHPYVFIEPKCYRLGNNDVQMPNLDVSTQMHVCGSTSNMFTEPRVFNNENKNQIRDESFDHIQFPTLDYSGCQSNSFSWDNISQQQIYMSAPQVKPAFEAIPSTRKRHIETNESLVHIGFGDSIVSSTVNQWKRNKNEASQVSSRDNLHVRVDNYMKGRQTSTSNVPIRRSQKLGDRITALQKLVSPYGKTDTASVLQEAHVYIQLLQKQIKNLYNVLSNSYTSNTYCHPQEMGKIELDLKSRGLCLVPVTFTHKFTNERYDSSSSSNLKDTNFISNIRKN